MSSQGPNLLNIGLLAAAGFLGYLYYATGEDEGSPSEFSKEKIKSIWTLLVKNMTLHSHQLKETLYSRRQEFQAQGVTEEMIEASYRNNFEEVLSGIQPQVLQHCGNMTAEEFEAATMQYSEDPEISEIVAELESLYLGEAEDQSTGEVTPETVAKLLLGEYTDAHISAIRLAAAEFRESGREPQENDAEFRERVSKLVEESLSKVLPSYGLDDTSMHKHMLKYQDQKQVVAAFQSSMARQAQVVQELGLEIFMG